MGGGSDGTMGATGRADVVGNHPEADGEWPEPGRVLCRRGIVGQQPAELETDQPGLRDKEVGACYTELSITDIPNSF